MLIDEKAKKYYPTLYVNDFWVYREHYSEINATTTELAITFNFEPKESWKWTLMVQMEESFTMQKDWGKFLFLFIFVYFFIFLFFLFFYFFIFFLFLKELMLMEILMISNV
jgi:hypothetical protein